MTKLDSTFAALWAAHEAHDYDKSAFLAGEYQRLANLHVKESGFSADGTAFPTEYQVTNPYELAKYHPDCVKIERAAEQDRDTINELKSEIDTLKSQL